MNVRVRRLIATALPPIVFGALFIGLWQWWVVAFEIQPFVVPRPSNIWTEFVEQVHLVREPFDPGGGVQALALHGFAEFVDFAGLQGQVRVAAKDRQLDFESVEEPAARRGIGGEHVPGDVHGDVVVLVGEPQDQAALDRGQQ